MLQMGYSQEEIQDSLVGQKYDEVMATYLLLDYRNSEVLWCINTLQLLAHMHKRYLLLVCKISVIFWTFQLDEGVNMVIKPRPGSDLTNSNAPSPPHKVQRSVSSTQKLRRPTDQGEI